MWGIGWGGVLFDGTSRGTTYTLADYGGFDLGGVDTRREAEDRAGDHGAHVFPGFLTGRSSWWKGLILTDRAEDQEHEIARLRGIGADGLQVRVFLRGPGLWSDVQRDGSPDIEVLVPGSIASYRVQVWSGDPRLYGDVREFAGGQTAVQYGNFSARPVLIVSGDSPSGYTVTGPGGKRVVVTKAITAGAPHTIDFAKGGLYVGGVRQLRAVSIYEPWTVGPGSGAAASVNNGLSLIQRVTDTNA